MSILSGYKKFKKYIKTSSGFQLQSLWTSANTVEADDKRTIQTKVGAINGISSSETANSAEIAASTALTNKMNGTINNLSRDLGTLDDNVGGRSRYYEYANYPTASAIGKVIDNHFNRLAGTDGIFNCLFKSSESTYYMKAQVADNSEVAGIIQEWGNTNTYAFFRPRGADAVLKKLGNDSPNTITVNILKGNGRKSLEGMSSVVLTKQENGRYAVTSAPKSFGIRDGNGTVDWDYNMGGASITQE